MAVQNQEYMKAEIQKYTQPITMILSTNKNSAQVGTLINQTNLAGKVF